MRLELHEHVFDSADCIEVFDCADPSTPGAVVIGWVVQLPPEKGWTTQGPWAAFRLSGRGTRELYYHRDSAERFLRHAVRQTEKLQAARRRRAASRHSRPRDAQRKKVYAAEELAFRRPPEGFEPYPRQKGRTLDQATRYANHIAGRVGRAGQVPPFKLNRRRGAFHRVWFGTGSGAPTVIRSQIDFSHEAIELDWVIIHELCHEWSDFFSIAGHGREWCALYLATVREVLGERWHLRLKGAFDVLGVKYRAKREISDEQRAILRERLAAARAAKQGSN